MNYKTIEVIVDNVENNPQCFHGPTLLFRQLIGKKKEYYACSACRDHKECNFHVPVDKKLKKNNLSDLWIYEQKKAVACVNELKLHKKFLRILNACKNSFERNNSYQVKVSYCHTCSCLFENDDFEHHKKCNFMSNVTYYQLTHPTNILMPKVNAKNHAQYFFSDTSTKVVSLLLKRLKVSKILCIGVPKIHEYILNNYSKEIKSLLLDIDRHYYNFYSKNQFIWYNMFNHHIFDESQKKVLENFMKYGDVVVLMDPPFGGRIEPLARTLELLNSISENKKARNSRLETLWFFPYFMERHIVNSLQDFKMFDYKVNYQNHASFTDIGNRKRKFGSPVRIFTNIPLARLDLKGISGYKFCRHCGYWVSNENRHCVECNACTSKNGRTYVHCSKCFKCVKPSYVHCETCSRCCPSDHVCGGFQADLQCYHCHQLGHKKNECPNLGKRKKSNSSPLPKKKRRSR